MNKQDEQITYYIGHFGDGSFQSIIGTDINNQTHNQEITFKDITTLNTNELDVFIISVETVRMNERMNMQNYDFHSDTTHSDKFASI